MAHGEPLTDADCESWLEALRDHETSLPSGFRSPSSSCSDSSAASTPTSQFRPPHLIMTCSALKQHYRDILREGGEHAANLCIRFVFLEAPEHVLAQRAAERKGHCAGPELVKSQFMALEVPTEEERERDVLVVGTEGREVEDTIREVRNRVREAMMETMMESEDDDEGYLALL